MPQFIDQIEITPAVRDALERVVASSGATFSELISISGLSPSQDLVGANLKGLDFGEANLDEYNLSFANLEGANLESVHIGGLMVDGANVRGVRWPKSRDFEFEECLIRRVSSHLGYGKSTIRGGELIGIDVVEWRDIAMDGIQLTLSGSDLREEYLFASSLVDELGCMANILALSGIIFTKADFENTFRRSNFAHTRVRQLTEARYKKGTGRSFSLFDHGGPVFTLGEVANSLGFALCDNASVSRARILDEIASREPAGGFSL